MMEIPREICQNYLTLLCRIHQKNAAKQLKQALHSLQTQNELVHHENDELRGNFTTKNNANLIESFSICSSTKSIIGLQWCGARDR